MFGNIETAAAGGVMLGHRLSVGERVLQKGHVLSAQDVLHLLAHGVLSVVGHRLEDDEVDEGCAASMLGSIFLCRDIVARAAVGGRVNFYSKARGLFRADGDMVNSFNEVDDAITFACLQDYSSVDEGELIGTLKVIPLAVRRLSVERALHTARASRPIQVRPFRRHTATIISTTLPTLGTKTIAKTLRITGDRLAQRNSTVVAEISVDHSTQALSGVLAAEARKERTLPHIIIVFGASAVADANDVIPAALRAAGGTVERVGMPVDPGNLAVLGKIGDVRVIGAPGCARSPAMNGLDWILDRAIAGEELGRAALGRMGVGGLLAEIGARVQPREMDASDPVLNDLRQSA